MLLRLIASREPNYDFSLHLLRSPFSSPGYHTTIQSADFIHANRENLLYALGLLDTEEDRYLERACSILSTVIGLQDTDPTSATYGIWSWFYEEPLAQMAPPDWNWADFCGKTLALIVARHKERLPRPLAERVGQAISHACEAIIRRNVGPEYTNIAIMGAFVTLLAGELYGRDDYLTYGLNRLEKLHAYTFKRGAFQEFNSPTYTYVAILELAKIRGNVVHSAARTWADELIRLGWKSVAEHYHAATNQWGGPHARCYRTLLSPQTKAFLQLATGGKLPFYDKKDLPYEEEWFGIDFTCPADLLEPFVTVGKREQRVSYAGDAAEGTERFATTWMEGGCCLGSFSNEILWNQKRALLAYIDNGGEAAYLHFRCLHDGYDYCSAQFRSVQQAGRLLFGVHFLVNGGDTHPNLDKVQDGRIEATDLRLRLELGGNLEGVACTVEDREVVLLIGETEIRLNAPFAVFAEAGRPEPAWCWELTREEDIWGIDLVIHRDEKRIIDFNEVTQAGFLFTLAMEEKLAETAQAKDTCSFQIKQEVNGQKTLSAEMAGARNRMELTLPLVPVRQE